MLFGSKIFLVITFILVIGFIAYRNLVSSINPLPVSDYKILTAVVTIDRDVDIAPQLYSALIENGSKDIIIVTRVMDRLTQDFWSNKAHVITVSNYNILERHNIEHIAKKRSIITRFAKNKYDAIWFVDSDVIPKKGTLNKLKKTKKDICIAPYRVKWTNYACVGLVSTKPPYFKIHKITNKDKLRARKPCIIGGFGCTLIKASAFDIKIDYGELQNNKTKVSGEDIGFFLNCCKAGLQCEYLTRWEQPHIYDR